MFGADRLGEGAAGAEAAAGGDVNRGWDVAFDFFSGDFDAVEARHGGEEGAGVGVARVVVQLVGPSKLDDLALST